MDLQYITRSERDEDGRPFDCHYLADMTSGRVYGYVEEPSKGSDQFMFVVSPYCLGEYRRYLSLQSAKAYMESAVSDADFEECQKLTKSVTEKPAEASEKKEA